MKLRHELAGLLSMHGIDANLLEIPPDPAMGDLALPCFALAKTQKKSPVALAIELAKSLAAPFLRQVRAQGPYVNFTFEDARLARDVLHEIHAQGSAYGSHPRKHGRVMIEYSQPNTHKAFHVGHLRGTALGEALARIMRHAGHEVIQANYSGDTGMHIAKWLWYYTTHETADPPKDRKALERWIATIYVHAVQALTQQPEHQAEVDRILQLLDRREPGKVFDIYTQTRGWSIDAFNEIYRELHAHFDEWFFESEVEERGKEASRDLVARGIARVDDGATIMDLEDENLGVWVLLRKDGTALYSAKDIALAERKFNEFKITESIYIIGAAQSLHMQQLFATLRRMGFLHADKCYHLSIAEVRLPSGKMSSRTGQNVLYSDIKDEIATYAAQEVRSRHPDWSDEKVAAVASDVTVAALKWDMLQITPTKAIVFDAKRATEFEGETGPYLQYTYARACSILAKAGAIPAGDGSHLVHDKERQLLLALAHFPDAVATAARTYESGVIARYAMGLAKLFNSFYHDCPVLTAERERADRVALVAATIAVLGSALGLLAIDAPREM